MTRRVALVHDWLVHWGGSESVLLSMSRVFPDAPIFTSVWAPDEAIADIFDQRDIRPTFLQRLPGRARFYRHLLPLMPSAFRSLDLSDFDLVLTSSHAFSKAVRPPSSVPHVCYCYTPPRYLWNFGDEERGFLQRTLLRGPLLAWLRQRDLEAARGVTRFVADCQNIRERIAAIYGRDSEVLYPPVDLPPSPPVVDRGSHFVAGGRLVRYKRVDLAIEAANRARVPLVVFGDGPELPRLRHLAGPTVSFTGRIPVDRLTDLLASARAFVFPGEEDFGLLPLEAQAVGTPVVAYGRGGVLETVIPGRTGVFFGEQEAEVLAEVLAGFDGSEFDRAASRRNAERFARPIFERRLSESLSEMCPA